MLAVKDGNVCAVHLFHCSWQTSRSGGCIPPEHPQNLLMPEPAGRFSTKLAVPTKKRQEVCSQWLDDIITCSLPLRLAKGMPSFVLQLGNLIEGPVMLSNAGFLGPFAQKR